MDMRKLIAFLTFIGLFCLNCFAYELPRIHVFHINGVDTNRVQANYNRLELEKDAQISSQFLVSAYGTGHFDLLYNQTHGIFLDVFWDVLGKKFKEKQVISLDDYAKSYMQKNPDKAVPESSPAYAQLKLDIESEYKNIYFSQTNFDDLIDQFHGKVPAKFSPLLSYLKSFQESGTIDYKNESMDYIILLPHSQGNLYANDIYDWLTKNENFYKNNITLFGIADPTSYINGQYGSNYITADNDGVINMLRCFTIIPHTAKPLSANLHLESCGDSVCHSLIKAYLNNENSRNSYQENIKTILSQFICSITEILESTSPYYLRISDFTDDSTKLNLFDPENNLFFNESNASDFIEVHSPYQPTLHEYFPKNFKQGEYKVTINSNESINSSPTMEIFLKHQAQSYTQDYHACCRVTDVSCNTFIESEVTTYISDMETDNHCYMDWVVLHKQEYSDWFLKDQFIIKKIIIQ